MWSKIDAIQFEDEPEISINYCQYNTNSIITALFPCQINSLRSILCLLCHTDELYAHDSFWSARTEPVLSPPPPVLISQHKGIRKGETRVPQSDVEWLLISKTYSR